MNDIHQKHLSPGTRIEQYEIRELLGVGGFGITYRAWDTMLQRWVAIKEFLPSELAVRDGTTITIKAHSDRVDDYRFALDKFLEEARTLAKFDHPNIVPITGFFEANGTAYLVMKFVEGESLSNWLKNNAGPVPEERLKAWFIPVLKGLVEVHKAGFLHRDIKPGNIYLRADGEPLLIDFGAARQAIGEHSRSVTGIVSAGYAPTEQYGTDVKKQGPWTDLYSVGATFYRCISGKDPVDAPTRQSAQFEGDPDPLQSAREIAAGQYSVPFLQLIDELLVLPIKQRPQTAEPVLEALQAGRSLSPQEPRSTVVTQVIAPHTPDQPARSSAPPTPPAAHAAVDSSEHARAANTPPAGGRSGTAWKAVAALVLVAAMGSAGYLLGTWDNKPEDAVANTPPVTTVQPTPQASADAIAAAPPVVAVQPEPAPVQAPEPEPTMGQLTLNLSPSNAKVVLPDIGPSYSPGMTLEPGSYRVKVSAPGYKGWEARVEVGEEHTRFDVSLEPLPQRPVGEVFRDTLSGGGEGPQMVVLPTGSFRMGDISGEGDADEKPVHPVSISHAIAMGRYEVTVGDFRRFANATGYRTEAETNAGGVSGCYTMEIPTRNKWDWTAGRNWRSLEYTVEEGQPVTCISWNDAQAYVKWLSHQTGKRYRLPSEAEWEYAARAGSSSKYHFGNDADQLCRYGNVADTTELPGGKTWTNKANCSDGAVYPTDAGRYAPNGFGLYDVHGNVWEWVEDCGHDTYQGAPQDGAAWVTGGDCATRVLRGGSWSLNPGYLRSAARSWLAPSYRNYSLGLRLVQDLDP